MTALDGCRPITGERICSYMGWLAEFSRPFRETVWTPQTTYPQSWRGYCNELYSGKNEWPYSVLFLRFCLYCRLGQCFNCTIWICDEFHSTMYCLFVSWHYLISLLVLTKILVHVLPMMAFTSILITPVVWFPPTTA